MAVNNFIEFNPSHFIDFYAGIGVTYLKNFCEFYDYDHGLLKRGSSATNKNFFLGFEVKQSHLVYQFGIHHDFDLKVENPSIETFDKGSILTSKKVRTMRTQEKGQIFNTGFYSTISFVF